MRSTSPSKAPSERSSPARMVSVSASSAPIAARSDSTTSSTEEPTASMDPSAMPMTSPSLMGLSWASFESLMARVTSPVLTSAYASVIDSTLSSKLAPSSKPNNAANASGTLFVGTTAHGVSDRSHALWAAMMMFLLFGRMMTASALTAPTASSRSFVEGFMVWPPDTTTSTPRLSRILALPSPAATATKPSGLRSAASSAASASVRAALCSCMLWMWTSEICAP